MVEGHEASSVTDAVVGLEVEFRGHLDILEIAHHQEHPQHAERTGHQALQQYLQHAGESAHLGGNVTTSQNYCIHSNYSATKVSSL